MKPKKGEMGVGTLIVFIAMLLVAAVAAGVLIQTAGSLQEKSLSTGQQARSQISTNARVVEVSATDGQNGNLTDFREIIKLSPGSDPIKLSQIIFSFNTKDRTSTLKYRGIDCICAKNNTNGYNTWNSEEFGEMEIYHNLTIISGSGGLFGPSGSEDNATGIDFDDDGTIDRMRTCDASGSFCPVSNDGDLQFNMSTDGLVYVTPINDDGTPVDLDAALPADRAFNFTHLGITGGYGYIKGWRTSGIGADYIHQLDPDIYFEFFESEQRLEEDIDDDKIDDLYAVNHTHAIFFFGSGEQIAISLGVNIASSTCQTIDLTSAPISNGTTTFGYLSIQTPCARNRAIPANATIYLTPYEYGKGYFSAIYETEGTNHVAGNLQRGDVVRLCFEAPGPIGEDTRVRLNFIPKIGTPTLTEFVTPDVISTERVYLYP